LLAIGWSPSMRNFAGNAIGWMAKFELQKTAARFAPGRYNIQAFSFTGGLASP
jgi:hypothetical protein